MARKRLAWEDFGKYRERLERAARELKKRIQGGIGFAKVEHSGGLPGQKIYCSPEMKSNVVLGKRHPGEKYSDFKLRRKLSNARRREREKR